MASIFPALDVEKAYGHLRVAGAEKVDGVDAWKVLAFPPAALPINISSASNPACYCACR
jgi:hypothetical protein